jgi:hypothetical protein
MALLGRLAWRMPTRLERVTPRISIEDESVFPRA